MPPTDSSTPPVFIQHHPARQRGLNRRQMVQRMLAGAGAGMALPALAAAHPIHRHLADPEAWAQADAQVSALQWSPAFFDPHQNETFIVLAELIVPGSTSANVNRFVDLLLSVDSMQNQRHCVNSISAFDGQALDQFGRPYKDLSPVQQLAILSAAAALPLSPADHSHTRRPASAAAPAPEPVLTMRDHFENLKGWVSGAYYSSEIGLKDLGWTGQMVWSSYPGCDHAGGHA